MISIAQKKTIYLNRQGERFSLEITYGRDGFGTYGTVTSCPRIPQPHWHTVMLTMRKRRWIAYHLHNGPLGWNEYRWDRLVQRTFPCEQASEAARIFELFAKKQIDPGLMLEALL